MPARRVSAPSSSAVKSAVVTPRTGPLKTTEKGEPASRGGAANDDTITVAADWVNAAEIEPV